MQEPYTLFALECSECDMWSLPVVEATMAMMVTGGHWGLHEVDQCAFGRLEQKPTKILTTIKWSPVGITSKPGYCVIGECAGTMGNSPGDRRHRGRVMQDSQAWRSERKITAADRRGLNTKAYNNEVAHGPAHGPGDSASSDSDGRQGELVTRGRDRGDNTQRRACLSPRSAGVRLWSTRTVEAVSAGSHEQGLRAQLGRFTR